MKKIEYCFAITIMAALFTSCFEDVDNWYTNTSEYDGRYVVATTCDEYSDDDQTIRDGNNLMIYNSATNAQNQIIIDSYVAINKEEGISYHVKGKFSVEGSSSNFNATSSTPNIASSTSLNDDEYLIIIDDDFYSPSDLDEPTEAGEEVPGVQLYSRLSIDEGKIISKGATTIGGNVSDSVYLAITTYAEYLTIESYQIPEDEWIVPGVPEYGWRVKDGSRTNADGWEEHWKFSGYRYTGLPEDNPSTKPPITEK